MTIQYIYNRILKKIQGSAIKNSIIDKSAKIEAGSTIINSTFSKHSFCGYNCTIINTTVGSFCSIADGVSIGLVGHPITWVSTSPVFYKGRDSVKMKFSEHEYHKEQKVAETIIGNDVWVGERALIKAGVNIGHGSIIGMGSVVTKDVPSYAIVGGNPAKIIRYRFDEETIKNLLAINWWDYTEEQLYVVAVNFNDVDAFLDMPIYNIK